MARIVRHPEGKTCADCADAQKCKEFWGHHWTPSDWTFCEPPLKFQPSQNSATDEKD